MFNWLKLNYYKFKTEENMKLYNKKKKEKKTTNKWLKKRIDTPFSLA
jgi:hypothetical protein